MRKIIAITFIILSFVITAYVWYANSRFNDVTRVFSPYTILTSSWERYKEQFINQDGRVIDYSQQGTTTSEGQSYAMLRAVWVDDKQTFDLVWQWTRENLKRPNDNLFGWKWGEKEDKSFGFLKDGGENTASDANSDIALALILAARRWGNAEYANQATEILKDMWQIETITAGKNRYLIAGNWASSDTEAVINPSYFSPYAWRIFATIDKEHDWESLITPAYDLLRKSGQEPMSSSKSVGLPPDWVILDLKTGALKSPTTANLTTNYSYDAMRVPFRIALDYQWNNEPQAYEYLSSLRFLADEYTSKGKINAQYSHSGDSLQDNESPAMYGAALGYFLINQPELAEKYYQDKIIKLYSNSENAFNTELPYYEQNWLWFGAALYNHQLQPFDSKKAGNQ